MLLKEIFNDFNLKYSNSPIEFEDKIISDGVKNSYELSYNPLCDYDPYRVMVYKKSGNSEIELLEGADYIINYELGVIQFLKIPEESQDPIFVRGFFQKCNLAQFIGHYNTAIRLMQTNFPIEKMVRVDGPADTFITSFRTSDQYINKLNQIKEVYQNEDDKNFVPFTKRDELIILNPSASIGKDFSSPGDYGGFQSNVRPGIKYPFYVLGYLKYQELPITSESLLTSVDFEYNARNQIVLLIGRYMYESWLHKSWSLTTTVLNINEIGQISKLIMSIDMQLYGDLRTNFTPAVLPNTRKEEYKAK